MQSIVGKIPRFEAEPAERAQEPEKPLPEVTNVAVRLGDLSAFLGVIRQREGLLDHPEGKPRYLSAGANEVASYALAAGENLTDGQRHLAIENLEVAAALAITAIGQLKEAS